MNTLPKHVAIIPDGNRRWAKAKGLQPWLGHEAGVAKFREAVETLCHEGVEYVTFWAASFDNLTKRSKIEVTFLLTYLKQTLANKENIAYFQKQSVRVRIIGKWMEKVEDAGLVESIRILEQETGRGEKYEVTILFGYDGKQEMLDAVNAVNKSTQQADEHTLRAALSTGHLPDVDLVIRTGGEPHWSAGFLMWLTANSQFYFTEMLWPDFGALQAKEALADFARRQRRLGA